MSDSPEDIVSISNSQVLRFIDEIKETPDYSHEISNIFKEIKSLQSLSSKSLHTREKLSSLYKKLYSIRFQPDYCCIIMDSEKDYDRCNEGFKINGIPFRRFIGTNGGVKKSTIIYINEDLYPEISRRAENGRNKNIPLVPPKFESYKALICSASIPLPTPRIIVVNDCVTHFKDDIIMLENDSSEEPTLTFMDNADIELTDSDGYGLMTPEYSRIVNGILNGDSENTIPGINTRFSFEKGMVYTYDFIEFAEDIAGTYELVDAWGDVRDVRDADVILTTSMLKLWDSYDNYEDYLGNCVKNNYRFSASKTAPNELEHVRDMNYQFLQSFEFTDEEIEDLCNPTIEEVNDILGLDYLKTLLYLKGTHETEESAKRLKNTFIDALTIEPRLLDDPFIRRKIYSMLKKRMDDAKKGCITINGNFALICGDPYALCQSMFGLEVTGILKQGECYHKYWQDKNTSEIAVFRAPMTCHNNIRKLTVVQNPEANHWYKYIKTCLILNSWDMTCEATNGSDKDGDMFFSTDNSIILKNVRKTRPILCVQKKADKKIITEEDLIKANKLSFGDEIGFITNIVTSMIERLAGQAPDSEEYKILEYRIMCGQLYQQNSIDKAKGIISNPMPEDWYDNKHNIILPEDSDEVKKKKKLYYKIAAEKKPYFMKYVYPDLKKDYDSYAKNIEGKCAKMFNCDIATLRSKESLSEDEQNFLSWCEKLSPVADNPCVVNKICWALEKEFSKDKYNFKAEKTFDYSILKSGASYSRYLKDGIKAIYAEYLTDMKVLFEKQASKEISPENTFTIREMFISKFKNRCNLICPDEYVLCDILLDICYTTNKSKQFVWDICSHTIIKNILSNNNNIINYPQKVLTSGTEYHGEQFILQQTYFQEGDL